MGEPGWLPGAQAGVTGPANLPLLFTPTPTHRLPVSSPPARSPGRGALSPLAVTGSHSPLSGCPPLGLVQSWPEPAGVTVTGQKWKNGKIVWVLAVTPSPSDEGAAAGPSWSRLVPGPGRSLWLSDWDSERPYVQTGLKIPVPSPQPAPWEEGRAWELLLHLLLPAPPPPLGPEPWEGQWAGHGWSQRLLLWRRGVASPSRAWPCLFGLALSTLVFFLKI